MWQFFRYNAVLCPRMLTEGYLKILESKEDERAEPAGGPEPVRGPEGTGDYLTDSEPGGADADD